MQQITLKTVIDAPAEVCFNCSRDIDLHKRSMTNSNEEAIAGTTSGLIKLGESVTWRAKHLGLSFKMTSKITAFEFPFSFTDDMISGPFKMLKHVHKFEVLSENQTLMTDIFEFAAPFGFLGKLTERLILKNYMTRLLTERNTVIKKEACLLYGK